MNQEGIFKIRPLHHLLALLTSLSLFLTQSGFTYHPLQPPERTGHGKASRHLTGRHPRRLPAILINHLSPKTILSSPLSYLRSAVTYIGNERGKIGRYTTQDVVPGHSLPKRQTHSVALDNA